MYPIFAAFWVGARATDLQGSIVDNLWRYADGVKSAHKGT